MAKNFKTRVLVFGTFDVLHPGHANFFKQARRLAKYPFLIVSVGRDFNVKRIKGRKPVRGETSRLKQVKKFFLVDKAVLGAPKDYLNHIIKLRPNIIALGYDQKAYTKGLRQKLAHKGLKVKIVRLKAYKPGVYKTSLYHKGAVER
jgi:FAD synthetase